MDSSPYHTVQVDNASKKLAILDWLEHHGLQTTPEMKKGQLLERVNSANPRFPVYEIEELAKSHGHEIIHLPLFHCHFNSVELIWSQVKGMWQDIAKSAQF